MTPHKKNGTMKKRVVPQTIGTTLIFCLLHISGLICSDFSAAIGADCLLLRRLLRGRRGSRAHFAAAGRAEAGGGTDLSKMDEAMQSLLPFVKEIVKGD